MKDNIQKTSISVVTAWENSKSTETKYRLDENVSAALFEEIS